MEQTGNMNEQVLFEEAVCLASKEERDAFLAGACRGDESMRARLDRLIAAHEKSGDFMNSPTLPHGLSIDEGREKAGTVIGRYKLLQEIGEGGMGVVYMAEQTEPVTRKVALKIIKLGMDTKQVVARFEAERQALAMMDHPNIAKVLDAGSTEAGRPYFVMELVRGVPITEYCDKNRLSAVERLALFVSVCHAIQHAHQKGVIHRDIKPSNVMVTLHDGKAVPKVIDFGIAKATNQKLTEKTLFTHYAQMIGTPAYMSPEQAEMSGLDVDTRTDVYSLGVLLYELLTGMTPFPSKELMSLGYAEMQRVIAEEEPAKPSTLLSTMQHEERTVVARNRSSELAGLNKVVSGDLDWIVMKSLEKDRSRRYDTANALAADIQRFQENEPIVARPPTPLYRFRKAWKRNHVIYSGATLLVITLVAGLTFSIIGFRRALHTQDRLAEQREVANRKAIEAEEATIEADAERVRADLQSQQLRRNLYYERIALAYREMTANRPAHALKLLDACPEDHRSWEWNHVKRESLVGGHHFIDFEQPVHSLTVSPNGLDVALVLGETLHIAKLSPEGEWSQLQSLGAVPRPFWDVTPWTAFSPDSRWLASIGLAGQINLWDVRSRELAQSFGTDAKTLDVLVYHPSGDHIAVVKSDVFGASSAIIDYIEVPSGRLLKRIETKASAFNAVFSPDGRYLAVGMNIYGRPHGVYVFDGVSGEQITKVEGHLAPVSALSFSLDSRWLASAGGLDVKIWDVSDWSLKSILEGHNTAVTSLAFTKASDSEEPLRLISAGLGRELKIWDPSDSREVISLSGHQDGISSLALMDDGRIISSDFEGEIHVWESSLPEVEEALYTLRGHKNRAFALAFHPYNSGRLYSAGDEGSQAWDIVAGEHLASFPGIWDVTTSDDGRFLIHPGTHEPIEHSWTDRPGAGVALELNDPLQLNQYQSLANPDLVVYFTADISGRGDWVAGGTADGELHVWRRQAEGQRIKLFGHQAYISRVRFSPDDRYLVSVGRDGEILRWDMESLDEEQVGFRLLAPTASVEISHIDFSPDGQRLVTGDGFSGLMVMDLESGKSLMKVPKAHGGIVVSTRFSPDGQWIVSGGTDHVVRLWDAKSGEARKTLIGHTSAINDAVFSPDGKRIASTGWDKTIRVWRFEP